MPGRDRDDEQLIHKAKCGNADAFGELYERYAEAIYRFLYSHLQSQDEAEDLTEEIFIRAWKALPNYDERGLPFSAFLYRSARNALVDYYRQRHITQPIGDVEWRSEEPGPEEEVSARIEGDELKRTLQQLREDYRSVLIFRFLSGMSPEETAVVMQRSVGAIRVLQHRALTALKGLLERGTNEPL